MSWKIVDGDQMALPLSHIFFHRARRLSVVAHPDTSVQDLLFTPFVQEIFDTGFFLNDSGAPVCPATRKTFKLWTKTQPDGILEPNEVRGAMRSLQAGDSLALYICEQNAGLIFQVPTEPHPGHGSSAPIILSTFAPSQSSGTVMSAPGDLLASFPGNSIHLSQTPLLKSRAFAKQLEMFHWNQLDEAMRHSKKAGRSAPEMREVVDPLFITQWLPAFLSESSSSVCQHGVSVIKKIRDDIIYPTGTYLPFRRSGFWMTLKVVLQISLTQELGEKEGLLVYKIMLLHFMCQLAQAWMKRMDPDAGVQILRKLTRRMLKLDDGWKIGKFGQGEMYERISRRVCTACESILISMHAHLNANWNQFINMEVVQRSTKWNVPDELRGLTRHKLNQLKQYFQSTNPTSFQAYPDGRRKFLDVPHRVSVAFNPNTLELFPVSPSVWAPEGEESTGILLQDFETHIAQLECHLTFGLQSKSHAQLVSLFKTYLAKGKSYYKSDPVGWSKMMLTLLRIIKIMDTAICNSPYFQLLKDHSPGVRTSIIPGILLTDKADLQAAARIEHYFEQRDQQAFFPSLIGEESVSPNSFSVRYASSNPGMQSLKQHIQNISLRHITEKKLEVERAKMACADLRAEAEPLEHRYSTGIKRWHKKKTCQKCRLEKKIKGMAVAIYEKPLPAKVFEQDAVLFELMTPLEISSLRDVLFLFEQEINPAILKSENIRFWIAQTLLSCHVQQDPFYKLPVVFLGSSNKAVTGTHYNSLHPEQYPSSSFISENGFNCVYGGEGCGLYTRPVFPSIKSLTTLSVESGTQYAFLQKYLVGATHSENDILAKQNECSQKLSLGEYKAFGTLRAGHRLQWHNIFRSLSTGSLNFKEESVYNLICQAAWEGGPRDNGNQFWRESHESLRDPFFMSKFLATLDVKMKENSKNWDGFYILSTVIVILTKILTVNGFPAILQKVEDLILASRNIAIGWCGNIEDQLTKMSSATVDQAEINLMRFKLIQVGICVGLTFDGVVVKNEEDYANWLHGIVKIQDNISLSDSSSSTLPICTRNSLRQVRRIGMALEAQLDSTIINRGLKKFLKSHWCPTQGSSILESFEFKDMAGTGQNTRAYSAITPNYKVTMDIICGTFTVNGLPVGRLPDSIRTGSTFQRVFGGMIFEVTPTIGIYSYMTESLYSYNGRKYSFAQLGSNQVIITETSGGGNPAQFQLIPCEIFSGELPYRLVNNYSHWYSQSSKLIQFRPVRFQDSRFLDPAEFTLSLTNGELTEEFGNGRKIVDIKTKVFADLVKVFEKLEHPNHLLVFSDGNELTADLPRCSLHFKVTESEILSKEYSGMKVAENEALGTLIGLRNRLLLVSTESDFATSIIPPILLVPPGEVKVESRKGCSATMSIGTENLSIPEYFAFEVDSHLGRIKAGQSHCGWLYLAYLHAITSHPLPDPFTSMTGTESALQLLQSACCWSGEPLSHEIMKILKAVAELSPKIHYYPRHLKAMQVMDYGPGLTPMVAHDGFRFIVEKLIGDSQRLDFLFKNESEVEEMKKGEKDDLWNLCDRELCERAYHRNRKIFNEQGLIQPHFFTMTTPRLQSVSSTEILRDKSMEPRIVENIRILAHLTQHQLTGSLSNLRLLTKEFGNLAQLCLFSDEGNQEGVPVPLSLLDMANVADDFHNHWFLLYETARRVKDQKLDNQWSILLSYLAYQEVSLDHLLILHTVSRHPEMFDGVTPPPFTQYTNTSEADFNSNKILEILKSNAKKYFPTYQRLHQQQPLESDDAYHSRLSNQFLTQVDAKAEKWAKRIKSYWPHVPIQFENTYSDSPEFDFLEVSGPINSCLTQWKKNMNLQEFFTRVTTILSRLNVGISPPKLEHSLYPSQLSPPIPPPQGSYLLPNLEDMFQAEFHEDGQEARMMRLMEQMFTCRVSDEIKTSVLSIPKVDTEIPPFPLQEVASSFSCRVSQFYMDELRRSWDCHQESKLKKKAPKYGNHSQLKQFYHQNMAHIWNEIEHELRLFHPNNSFLSYSLAISSGLYPRVSALNLLALIKEAGKIRTKKLYHLLIAYGILLTQLQRENRILRYGHAGTSMERSLAKELENAGHLNWDPKTRPAWLLFEIEMDLMIREEQIQVALKMEEPADGRSSLMQLNMGEGKTTVILPLLISSLANRAHLCRVTVLRSLFQVNKDFLRASLGGVLLNKRLYILPCRRDFNITKDGIRTMKMSYKECVEKAGFVLTVPEFRLSFQLKGIEKCRAGELADTAVPLLNLQEWLHTNVRDVLDECDELLREKYQLVYTVGPQVTLDGGAARWGVIQKLLKLVPAALVKLREKHGPEVGECVVEPGKLESFPRCRIFKPDNYKELCEILVTEILVGRAQLELPVSCPEEVKTITDFLTIPTIDEATHGGAMSLYSHSKDHYNRTTLLVLRGLLASGILSMALSKRWRVNYGVNPKADTGIQSKRLSAVPFRAKDVAAERTEFGHPDVAIIFTQLSYYYQGLTDSQILESFKSLYDRHNATTEYDRWLSAVASPHPSIISLSGVNLKDYEQRTKFLFPVLRKNMAVIDFWLNHAVFPREAKVFGWKMQCTPWDLSHSGLTVTGFSGTNDTKLLLPLHITQQDLPELLGTNGKVLEDLMVPENGNYETLQSPKAVDIIQKLIGTQDVGRSPITVLLDVGALMLELSNEIVAATWLQGSYAKIEAAVYFDSNDVLMVRDRKGRGLPLEVSPYVTRLGSCVVYLDDGHTRGTDLKLPRGTSAAVTLGKGLGKDKFVQCCMRMRMLGNGHRVHFWSSPEVHNDIMDRAGRMGKTVPGTEDVIGWTLHNSITATRDGFMHWVNAGVSFCTKMAACAVFNGSRKTHADYQGLGERCSEKEVIRLDEMYGHYRTEEFFPAITANRIAAQHAGLKHSLKTLQEKEAHAGNEEETRRYSDAILSHCKTFVPSVKKLSQLLDEEQERELEHELEEELESPRAGARTPVEPTLAPELVEFVKNGNTRALTTSCIPLPTVLKNTNLWPVSQADDWGRNTFATNDFARVVTSYAANTPMDKYLRPVTWFLTLPGNLGIALLISPHEANELWPILRAGNSPTKLHLYSARLHASSDTLFGSSEVCVPSSSDLVLHSKYLSAFHQLSPILFMFSGSLYFGTKEEQDEFCGFCGYLPKNRSKVEQEVMNYVMLARRSRGRARIRDCFVDHEFRKFLSSSVRDCTLQRNPYKLIKGVIEARYDVELPRDSHVHSVVVRHFKAL